MGRRASGGGARDATQATAPAHTGQPHQCHEGRAAGRRPSPQRQRPHSAPRPLLLHPVPSLPRFGLKPLHAKLCGIQEPLGAVGEAGGLARRERAAGVAHALVPANVRHAGHRLLDLMVVWTTGGVERVEEGRGGARQRRRPRPARRVSPPPPPPPHLRLGLLLHEKGLELGRHLAVARAGAGRRHGATAGGGGRATSCWGWPRPRAGVRTRRAGRVPPRHRRPTLGAARSLAHTPNPFPRHPVCPSKTHASTSALQNGHRGGRASAAVRPRAHGAHSACPQGAVAVVRGAGSKQMPQWWWEEEE